MLCCGWKHGQIRSETVSESAFQKISVRLDDLDSVRLDDLDSVRLDGLDSVRLDGLDSVRLDHVARQMPLLGCGVSLLAARNPLDTPRLHFGSCPLMLT
eukprot:scaffold2022_cov261-Pinguiococcus_pyrenoidosus.AAC.17